MRIRKSKYTIRYWVDGKEEWFGIFKSKQEVHDYLIKNGWVCESPNEHPQTLVGYKKKQRDTDIVGENACIGDLTELFGRRRFKHLTKKPRIT